MLASLKTLLEAHPNGIEFEDAVEQLAMVFADNANESDYELDDDHPLAARRELRLWLKRGLIVERNACPPAESYDMVERLPSGSMIARTRHR